MPATRCPKCAYVRTSSDTAPDWQCPKCGIAYAKFQKEPASSDAGTRSPPLRSRTEGGSGYTVAMLAHLSTLLWLVFPVFAIAVPIIIWQANKDKDDFAATAAKEALNLQLSFLLGGIGIGVAAVFCAVAAPPLIFAVLAVLVAMLICIVVLPIVAAIKSLAGTEYSYPFIHRFVD